MPVTVGVYEAKTQLTKLLAAVEAGESVTITRHGKPIAELTPVRNHPVRGAAEVFAHIRELSKQVKPLDGETIKDMIEYGRR